MTKYYFRDLYLCELRYITEVKFESLLDLKYNTKFISFLICTKMPNSNRANKFIHLATGNPYYLGSSNKIFHEGDFIITNPSSFMLLFAENPKFFNMKLKKRQIESLEINFNKKWNPNLKNTTEKEF